VVIIGDTPASGLFIVREQIYQPPFWRLVDFYLHSGGAYFLQVPWRWLVRQDVCGKACELARKLGMYARFVRWLEHLFDRRGSSYKSSKDGGDQSALAPNEPHEGGSSKKCIRSHDSVMPPSVEGMHFGVIPATPAHVETDLVELTGIPVEIYFFRGGGGGGA
jgi:hypothetical protein